MSGADHLDEAKVVAASKGLVVVLPGPRDLFIDIDDAPSRAAFVRNFVILSEHEVGATFVQRPSPSGKHDRFHITVTLPRDVKDATERVMLQALLGSDLLHEILSWRSIARGNEHPSLFFERPGAEGVK